MKDIKCVVWDLDGTLWEGSLLESDNVQLKPGIREIIQILDSRGMLHSIASKNSYEDAIRKIKEFQMEKYFLCPEINWNAKSTSIQRIQSYLNIGMDTIMLIDDSPFERDEVRYVHPEVTCIDASEYTTLSSHPRLNPTFISEDSKRRRLMYLEDIERKREELAYKGPKRDFLASLGIRFIISPAKEEDLRRAEELTIRTNQLNTTGKTYSYDELQKFVSSQKHKLLICEMNDKYGSYGKIGLALIETTREFWYLRLFLMSCRVMSYGVGTVLLLYIMQEAKKAEKRLRVDFQLTGRNRIMYITLKFAKFKEIADDQEGCLLLENDLLKTQKLPSYIDLTVRQHDRG